MSFDHRVIRGLLSLTTSLPTGRHHRALSAWAEARVYLSLLTRHRDDADQPSTTPDAFPLQRLQEQLRDGLFVTGDNVMSPPDTAFTANSLARLVSVLELHPHHFAEIRSGALRLLEQIADVLVTGGIHTPNHRWEISSALTACGRLLGREDCTRRAQQWLAEGVDIQPDGFYSERSPNYAVHVSGLSLWALAHDLHRPELLEIVHTNVHTHAATTDAQGRAETIQSRRQDQFEEFSVSQFVPLFMRCAHQFGCTACGDWAATAQHLGDWNYLISAHDQLLAGVGSPGEAPREFEWVPARYDDSGLAVVGLGPDRLMAHRLGDHQRSLPIASGVNFNPVLFRWSADGGGVHAIRLARKFFNLGPLRPTDWIIGKHGVELRARESARYYQPLEPEHISATGSYEMEHEGRFAAAMAFAERGYDEVTLDTSIRATLDEGTCLLEVNTSGPAISMALEILLDPTGPDEAILVTSEATIGGVRIEVRSNGFGQFPVEAMTDYDPGDPYSLLHGTDRLTGLRAIVPLSSEKTGIIHMSLTN